MRSIGWVLTLLVSLTTAIILQNDRVRDNAYPGRAAMVSVAGGAWKSYPPNAKQISYKGRWDSKYISWSSALGLKFGFTGNNVAISFGNYIDQGVLVAYRLSAGQYATYEAYPGICLHDGRCYGNLRGQTYQWFHTSDTSGRAIEIWGDNPEKWDFAAHPAADIVVINLGTNDNSTADNVTNQEFYDSYIELVDGIHGVWPRLKLFYSAVGSTDEQGGAFITEMEQVYEHYLSGGQETFVHYFNTTGIPQHNDINPEYRPTDVGHVKFASHLMQYVKLKFGYVFGATGPEVQYDTTYWNTKQNY